MATTLNTRMGTLTPTPTYGAIKTLSSFASPKKSKRSAKTNNGSGIKYLGHKLGLGFLSSVEGIWDYTAGGAAKLFGETFDSDSAVKWAEKQFDKDWTNYNAADEWYNPSEGWRFAGDIAGGIGTSLPAMVGTALGAATIYLSGGTLSGVGAKLILSSISAGIAGFGAAGNATKEAYKASGKLDGSAFGYGALSGATEAGLEFLTGLAGKGSGKVVDAFAKKLGKDTAKAVGKRTAMTVIKDISGDFISEAIEEGVAEFVSPYYKRMTYDPLAKNATKEEIGYAALVGGISGVIMSGSTSAVDTSVTHTSNLISGKKSYDNGAYKSIYEIGQKFADVEMKHDTGIGAYQASKQTYDKLTESLKKHNDISTDAELLDRIKQGNIEFKVNDLFLLGEMSKTNAASALYPAVEKYSERLIYDAENAAAKFSSFGMKDANGNPINITADQLLEGIDRDLLEKAKKNTLSSSERKKFVKSVRKAMTTNSTLVTLAAAEVAGEITMDTKRMAESVLNGEQMATMADVSRLLAEGKSEEVEELGRALGISDWSTVSSSELAQKLASYNESGNISEWASQRKRVREAASIGIENTKQLPHILRKDMQDGTYRFASGDGNVDMAVIKEGESFYLYNYETGDISRSLTSKDVNSILKTYWTEGKVDTSSVEQDAVSKYAAKESELDTMAEKDIDDYKSLSAGSKASVRTTMRQAQAHGLSEEQTRLIATVSAKSGLNIEFDATMAKGEDGVLVGNTIYINPNNSEERTYEVILGHEMFHKLFANGGKRSLQLFIEAKDLIERSNPEKAQKVRKRYKEFYKKRGADAVTGHTISEEEVAAAGAEEVFRSVDAWTYILSKEPSFADKVLSFFRKSAREYSSIQGLSAQARKFIRHYKKLFNEISARNQGNNSLSLALDGAQRKTPIIDRMGENVKLTGEENTSKYKTPEEAKLSGEVSDARFSLVFSSDIASKQREYVDRGYAKISAEELQSAIDVTSAMVDKMLPHADILPQDKVGKTLVKNGSYDVSVENTTICIRTLAYNSFVDMVSEKVGRPLTQMESFLVSQKLYEIAKEPQCLYCYVSLDRKAFNEMIIRYVGQRDAAIKAYKQAGEPKLPSSKDDNFSLYKEFLYDGKSYRKSTQNMWDRYVGWIESYKKGEELVTLEDIATEARRADIARDGGSKALQVNDMLKYAQSASWAKKQTQYVAYYDEILKLKPQVIRNLNSHYGMRWYSFSDYSGAFIVENMQQITDAAIRGLKGLSYTKDTDFAEIFAPTGMNINISVYAKKNKDGGYEIDAKQSANIDEAIKLRKKYPNVGIVVVATDAEGVEWALSQEWSDVVIPFHTVRTGADVAEFYNWEIFNAEQSDTVTDQNLWDAYVESVGKKKASKMVYPSEHQNDRDTYLRICKERGLTPRFKSFLDNPNYMKLVNETRQSESQTSPLKAKFSLEAAERSFDKFVEKGGYYEGWYNDGIDVDGEAEIVAQDVKAGKKANEVSYGRQDINYDDLTKGRKKNRQHGASEAVSGARFALTESATPKITAEMSDAERAEIISKKQVVAPIYTGQADAAILANKDKLESGKVGIVAGVIQKLGEDFGVVREKINIEDVEVVITLSNSNLRKSVTAEATPGQLAKLIPVLKDTARSAIGIERHDNRYFFDSDTVYFDNLLGGYIDGNDFVPVRFGLKHSRTGNVVLYVVVDQSKIPRSSLTEIKKTEVVKTPAANADPEVSRSVTYSIAQIIEFVNSGDLLRYIPDEMLTEAQKPTKYEAIAKTIERTNTKNDERYAEYISNGNLGAAKQMVFNAAKAAGYTIEGYHGTRQTFTAFSNESKGSNTRTETSKRMFFAADKATANSYYPYGVMQAIHEQHPEWAWADPEKVKVKGNLYHLFIRMNNPLTVDVADYDYALHRDNADSWMEFVAQAEANHNDGIILLNAMDNQLDTSARTSTVYMFAQPSQAKSAETITYDDEGNVIPISKRFDAANPDIRYALTDEAIENRKNRAIEEFGTTNDFARTGFVTNDGRMLNLSQYGLSGVQHRIIERVFDGVKGEEAIAQFIREGNVRIKESSPGIEISADTALTQNQYNVVSRFISASLTKRGVFYLDITDAEGNEAASITYDNRDSSSGIIYDIKEYYKSGKIPEARWALTDEFDVAKGSVEFVQDKTKPKRSLGDKIIATETSVEIHLTNVHAGIERAGRALGMKNIEALVQRCRASATAAQEMIGGTQWKIIPNATKTEVVKLGDGLEPILAQVRDVRKGETKEEAQKRYEDFQYYLYHMHNVDRMSLKERSIAENDKNIELREKYEKSYINYKRRADTLKKAKDLLKGKYDDESKLERRRLTTDIFNAKTKLATIEKRLKEINKSIKTFKAEENKPVLRRVDDATGEYVPVTADESNETVKKYLEKYPEFATVSEKVYGFLNNLLQMQVDFGLIDRETYDYLRQKYPHYVPTYRTSTPVGVTPVRGAGNIEVSKVVKTATGSIETLDDLELSIARLTQKVLTVGNVNVLANQMYSASLIKGDKTYIEEVSRSKRNKQDNIIESEDLKVDEPKNNQISFYRDGEKITANVSQEVYIGFNDFNKKNEYSFIAIRAMSEATNLFKSLVTNLNPLFLVRNVVRDLQDAGINTKYAKSFVKNYARAIYHLANNTEYAQLYRAAGGFDSSIFEFAEGFTGKQAKGFAKPKTRNPAKKLGAAISNANLFVEQLPRFAEFISTIEHGGSVDQAILNAADVTTNFGRTGTLVRSLNRTVIPFLNPAVQGLSKLYRNFRELLRAGDAKAIVKAYTSLVIKCVILGIMPMALNNLMYHDDEDYEDVRSTDKENNYLFKVGKTWIKIPKGRFVSVIAGLANRTQEEIEGDADWSNYFENVISQVTPVENFTRPIWQPFFDAANNKTWYGTDIESAQFENVRPRDRYDESTSSIAIAIGKIINYSPKKIHYLLDSYTGVIGDFVLPATTKKAEKGAIISAFVFDPVTSNKLSEDFYKAYETAKYNKSDGNNTALYQVKYFDAIKSAVSEMYDEINDIQASNLPDAEKLQQVRTIRMIINTTYKTAVANYDEYTKVVESTKGLFNDSDDKGVKLRYTEITRRFYGAERAFEVYNSSTAKSMTTYHAVGVDYETLYNFYFSTLEIGDDLDRYGKVIEGSKRKKIVAQVNALNATREEKILMIYAKGYSIKDGDIRGVTADSAKTILLRYLNSATGLTTSQKKDLASKCGLELKNGRFILKS